MYPLFIQKLIYPQFDNSIQETDKRRLSTLHRLIIGAIAISAVYIVLEAAFGLNKIALNNLPILFTYIFCFYLFHKTSFNTARNIFLVCINLFVFISHCRSSTDTGLYFFFFPIASGTFFLFREQERKSLLLFALIPVLLLVASFTLQVSFQSPLHIPENLRKINFIFSAVLSLIVTLYCIYYYLKLYQKSAQQINRQKASLLSLLDNIDEPVCQFNNHLLIERYNESFNQFILKTFSIDIHDAYHKNFIADTETGKNNIIDRLSELLKQAISNKKIETEIQIKADSKINYFEIKINPVLINNAVSGAVMTLKNITKRVNDEILLRSNLEEKQKLSTVANTIKHSILITNRDFHITWSNPHFSESTGISTNEIRDKNAIEIISASLTNKNNVEHLKNKLLKGKSTSTEIILIKKNKEPIWWYLSSSPVFNENNEITSFIFIGLDITERKRSEEQMQLLLNHAQKLNKELEERDTELQASIRKLNKQSWEIQISKQHLQKKKNELEASNIELNKKAIKLEQTNNAIVIQNKQLNEARAAISQKAELLEQVSKYKSEFLANMSHELRTPLNSVIILSRLLAENKDSNLTRKQIEFAHVVHKSGTDLLNLINDILDLSKIEAGKIEIEKNEFELGELCSDLFHSISPAAKSKNIEFTLHNELNPKTRIFSDEMRLSQILKNLLSNAIKFTSDQGKVCLYVSEGSNGQIQFKVEDNGIGIPVDKQKLIFESFKQVDGSISRRFGGTGLGLSISKELTHLLSGNISVSSKEGEGSTFTVEIPIGLNNTLLPSVTQRKLLIIEDDEVFAGLLEKMALKEGFQTEICHRGDTGFIRIKESKPDAIILDMNIPGINGWNLIKRVKEEKSISHIPIHIISGSKATDNLSRLPVDSWFEKPASTSKLANIFKNLKNQIGNYHKVLVIEDSPEQSMIVKHLLKKHGISCQIAETGKEGFDTLKKENFDCIILDLNLPDSDGMTLLKKFKEEPEFSSIPVIVYSSRELNEKEKLFLKDYASSYINKNTDHLESLLEETNLFLQSVQEQKKRRQQLTKLPEKKKLLEGKRVLVVDDDARNIYALSSMLELYGMDIHTESDGASAVKYLENNPETDLILMDIMMPGMNGYEATSKIRKIKHLSKIPIIAVSAKAMKGDREISLASGLDDHITKPIEGSALINLICNYFQ